MIMRPVSSAYRIVVALIACVVGFMAAVAVGPLLSVSAASVHGASDSASDCASFGEAAGFAVFSDGVFNASATSGTTITGRIGAAGDVTLDGVSVGLAAGESGLAVLAGGNFNGGTVTGAGGTVSGGVSYGGRSTSPRTSLSTVRSATKRRRSRSRPSSSR
jgi:hypothetical protein